MDFFFQIYWPQTTHRMWSFKLPFAGLVVIFPFLLLTLVISLASNAEPPHCFLSPSACLADSGSSCLRPLPQGSGTGLVACPLGNVTQDSEAVCASETRSMEQTWSIGYQCAGPRSLSFVYLRILKFNNYLRIKTFSSFTIWSIPAVDSPLSQISRSKGRKCTECEFFRAQACSGEQRTWEERTWRNNSKIFSKYIHLSLKINIQIIGTIHKFNSGVMLSFKTFFHLDVF